MNPKFTLCPSAHDYKYELSVTIIRYFHLSGIVAQISNPQ